MFTKNKKDQTYHGKPDNIKYLPKVEQQHYSPFGNALYQKPDHIEIS